MALSKPLNIQDTFLNTMRQDKVSATVVVTNGFQIKNAHIKGFDNFVILLEVNGRQMLLYKHAISSITPDTPVHWTVKEQEGE